MSIIKTELRECSEKLPGSIAPLGMEIRKTKENANISDDSVSNRKQSHSMAAAE